jgi:mannose-6-phosphate isomerase-like protein (cupin superfamily)
MDNITDPAPVTLKRARALAAQPPVWGERVRGAVISWPADADWFDWVLHAPGPHSHPGASELFVVLEGAFELAVGPETVTLQRGEAYLVPPDVVHDPVGTAGTDLALVSIVSPNRKGLRAVMSDKPAAECPGGGQRAAPGMVDLPSNAQLECTTYLLGDGERVAVEPRRDVDRVLVVVEGEVDVEIGALGGRLMTGALAFVPARAAHSLVGRGAVPATVIAVWGTGLDEA